MTFSNLEYQSKGKKTRKEIFLEKMEKLVPWKKWCEIIQPYYYERGNGRPPIDLEVMLRMYMISNWYDLSDESCEEECISNVVFRNFVGNHIPDETTLGKFRNLLEEHKIAKKIFDEQIKTLAKEGILYKQGTIIDATIIDAPNSLKNKSGKANPEFGIGVKGTKKYFGMKCHIGMDAKSGIVHSVAVSPANEADITHANACLHGSETVVRADAGYVGLEKRPEICEKFADKNGEMKPIIRVQTCPKGKRYKYIDGYIHEKRTVKFAISKKNKTVSGKKDRANERNKARKRWKVEHAFCVLKHMFRFRKTRLSTLAKNESKLFMMFALVNIHKLAT